MLTKPTSQKFSNLKWVLGSRLYQCLSIRVYSIEVNTLFLAMQHLDSSYEMKGWDHDMAFQLFSEKINNKKLTDQKIL